MLLHCTLHFPRVLTGMFSFKPANKVSFMNTEDTLFLARLKQTLMTGLPVILWVVVLYGITQWITTTFFDFTVWRGVYIRDAMLNVVFGGALFLLCRSFWPWAIAYTLLVTVMQISNALKFAVLGSPIMPDDFLGFVNMFMLFDDWRLWALWAALLLPIALWVYAINWNRPLTWALLLLFTSAGYGFVENATPINRYMDKNHGDRVWDQPGNYRDRGLIAHVIHETSRNLARGKVEFTAEDIAKAKESLPQANKPLTQSATNVDGRNIYVILLESFFDPMALKSLGVSEDPMDPRFRKLWAESDHSTGLAPVYGGYTANSEFEVMCGFPVTHNAVFFEGWLRNDVPCLPGYLADAGYRSIASHPNHAAFWNRVIAYDRLGFSDYWARNEFDLDDMNGPFLSDASLFRQVWEKQSDILASGKPFLSYIVTYFGHLDYPLNDVRPSHISVENDPNLVERYMNTMYYKSREVMDFYEKLRAEDPDAVIVIFGDHLPFLGPNFDGYVESGVLERNKSDFSADMFLSYSETPLLIIDGQNGPVKRKQLPMYRIPGLIISLLGDDSDNMLEITTMPEGLTVRPLPGITYVQKNNSTSSAVTCVDGDKQGDCAVVDSWLNRTKMLTMDIFSGEQFLFR